MTHEGRMLRGAENFSKNILLDNEDTKYYLANKPKEEIKEEPIKEVKPIKKETKKNAK